MCTKFDQIIFSLPYTISKRHLVPRNILTLTNIIQSMTLGKEVDLQQTVDIHKCTVNQTIKDTLPGWTSTNPNNKNKWKTHIAEFVDDARRFVTAPKQSH